MRTAAKLLGLAMIFGGCILSGLSLEERMKYQWKLLTEWKEILCYLEKEMTWHRTRLPDALCCAAEGHTKSLNQFLQCVAERVRKRDGRAFEEIWKEALRETIKEEELSRSRRILLEEAAEAVSAQDAVIQKALLEKSVWHLEEAVKEAERDYQEKGKLYRRLSITAGAFLIIILL